MKLPSFIAILLSLIMTTTPVWAVDADADTDIGGDDTQVLITNTQDMQSQTSWCSGDGCSLSGGFAVSLESQNDGFSPDEAVLFQEQEIVAAVPEPSTWIFMIIGFALVMITIRNNKKKSFIVCHTPTIIPEKTI